MKLVMDDINNIFSKLSGNGKLFVNSLWNHKCNRFREFGEAFQGDINVRCEI